MSKAHSKVVKNPRVGRRGYKGKELEARRKKGSSPAVTDEAEEVHALQENVDESEMTRKNSSRLIQLERTQKESRELLDSVSSTTTANTTGIADFRTMLTDFIKSIQVGPDTTGIGVYLQFRNTRSSEPEIYVSDGNECEHTDVLYSRTPTGEDDWESMEIPLPVRHSGATDVEDRPPRANPVQDSLNTDDCLGCRKRKASFFHKHSTVSLYLLSVC